MKKRLVLAEILMIVQSIALARAATSVNVFAGDNVNVLKEEEILRVLMLNQVGNNTENLTLVELISSLENRSGIETGEDARKSRGFIEDLSNPYYDDFSEEIDLQARRLLQILPAYDPGAGTVSAECKRHANVFRRELSKFTLWALKMYDSTAKIPSGLLSGNVNQFGDFDECVGIEGSEGIQGQYCLAYLQLEIEQSRPDLKHLHRLLYSHYAFRSNVTDPGHRVPRFSTVQWAVCTPASCTHRDVMASLRHTLSRHASQTGLKISINVDPEMCQVKSRASLPKETILASLFFIGIIVLTLVAAIYDHYGIPASELLLSFSLKRNFAKLVSLKRGEEDIATLHGVRALNALMLIIAHKSMAMFFNPYVNRTSMAECLGRPWTVISRAASLYTDPFIMLSGLLTTYSFVGRLKSSGTLKIRNEYLSRLLRLIPTLGALILFCTYIMPYIDSGPQWNLVVTQHANICKQTWWRNFLFIHNYFGFENMCLTHTHHLGIDTQLFVLSPLMVLLLHKRPKTGALVLGTIAVYSTVLRYHVTYFRRLNNYVFFGTSIRQLFDTANYSYILPSHRITVYIIGIFVGYLLRRIPKGYKFNKTAVYIGWTVCSAMFLAAFFGPAKMGSINYNYDPTHAAMYNAFAPIGWCALFSWATITHHTGNSNGWLNRLLAWKGFMICTRLSYAIYLTQFPVFFYNVGKTRSAEHFDIFRSIFNFRELLWIVFTSLILTLLFDTPFQNLKNYLFNKSSIPNRKDKLSKLE